MLLIARDMNTWISMFVCFYVGMYVHVYLNIHPDAVLLQSYIPKYVTEHFFSPITNLEKL